MPSLIFAGMGRGRRGRALHSVPRKGWDSWWKASGNSAFFLSGAGDWRAFPLRSGLGGMVARVKDLGEDLGDLGERTECLQERILGRDETGDRGQVLF